MSRVVILKYVYKSYLFDSLTNPSLNGAVNESTFDSLTELQVMVLFSEVCVYVVSRSQTFRLTAEGLEIDDILHWSRPAHEAVWPKYQTTNHNSFRSASRFGAWKCRHNNRPVWETLGRILKILWRKLEIFHILLKIQHLVYPDKHLSSQL